MGFTHCKAFKGNVTMHKKIWKSQAEGGGGFLYLLLKSERDLRQSRCKIPPLDITRFMGITNKVLFTYISKFL
jgi:hypothetical protein